jgi:hypothetical protein
MKDYQNREVVKSVKISKKKKLRGEKKKVKQRKQGVNGGIKQDIGSLLQKLVENKMSKKDSYDVMVPTLDLVGYKKTSDTQSFQQSSSHHYQMYFPLHSPQQKEVSKLLPRRIQRPEARGPAQVPIFCASARTSGRVGGAFTDRERSG